MNYLKIANRNVNRQKKKSNMLTFAIAFGTMVIILIQSLTAGFSVNIETGITSALGGHIYINGDEQLESGKVISKISDVEILQLAIDEFDSTLIKSYQKRSNAGGTMIFHSQSTSSTVVGIDWEKEQTLKNDLVLIDGSIEGIGNSKNIILSQEVFEELGVNMGDDVVFSFQTVSGQANVAHYTIIGVAQSNSLIGVSSSYVAIDGLNRVLGLEIGEYQSLTIELNDANDIALVQQSIETSIEKNGGILPIAQDDEDNFMAARMRMFVTEVNQDWDGTRFTISNLGDYTEAAITIINIINTVAYVIFFIMLLITMVGLINTFRLIMNERVLEIGTMRAMGMQKKDVKKLFNIEGILIALKGVPYGVIIELIITRLVSLIPINPSKGALSLILKDNHLYFPINTGFIVFVAVLITIISLFAVSIPVKNALKKTVADELR